MPNQSPPLDGPPPRKRRRPALSCFECRRRKIKCDRNFPCKQCVQSRIQTCTFSPHAATGTAFGGVRNSIPTSSTLPSINETANADSAQSEKVPDCRKQPEPSAPHTTLPDPQRVGPRLRVSPVLSGPTNEGPPHGDSNSGRKNRIPVQRERSISCSTPKQSAFANDFEAIQNATPDLQGIYLKGRLYGPSHFKSTFEQFAKIREIASSADWNDTATRKSSSPASEVHVLIHRCKDLARKIKAQRRNQCNFATDLNDSIPSRAIADELKANYFRNFESAYRILHIPSFQAEYELYWSDPKAAKEDFVMIIFLVMAIGTCFCQNLASENQLRSKALEWIYAAQSWLSAPFQKGRLSVTGLQVHCLLLLARETNFVGPELVWISAGALLRTAIHMGLHRDSSHYPNMSPYNAEIRRRLWATVLEMAVQSSLDCGMPPLISYDDFDTAPPSNISDASLSPSDAPTSLVPHSLPPTTYTQTSLQIALLASLHTRLRVARLINHFRSKPTYEEVLHLSSRVMDSIREASLLLLAYNQPTNHSSLAKHPSSTPERPTAFHQNLLSHLQRRFLLALHRPFAIKALSNPQFYFSRKVCLEQALLISTPPPSPEYNRLASIGGGLWRETLTHGALTLCMELITQLDEDTRNVSLERQRAQRAPLHEAIRGVIGLAEERMRLGATNVKGLLFLNMALGQAEAIETGGAVSVEEGIFRAAKKAAQLGYEILRSRAAAAGVGNAVSIDVGSSRQDVAGNNNNRNMVGDGIAPPDAEMEEWLQDAILGDSDFDLGAKWLFPTLDEIPWASMGNFATQ